ncbi:hypothetical protein KAU45_07635, partial [bacterium]|nr:hypothetical protein [bacterium]
MNDKDNRETGGSSGLGSTPQDRPKFEGFSFTDPAQRPGIPDKPKPAKLGRLKAMLLYIALAGGALVIGMLLANYIIMPLLVGGEEIEVPDLT